MHLPIRRPHLAAVPPQLMCCHVGPALRAGWSGVVPVGGSSYGRSMPSLAVASVDQPVAVHYEDSGGRGRPVVLIHGWPLSGRSWARQVPALVAAGYRVIDYDRRGFGESDQPGQGYDYDTFSDDLAALLTALDLRDVTLVGFSMGGGEVARYVGRHGHERVRALAFLGAVPPYMQVGADNPDGAIDDAGIVGLQDGIRAGREEFFAGFTRAFFSSNGVLKVTERDVQDALALGRLGEDKAVLDCVDAFCRTDFRSDLAAIASAGLPTLVVHGDSDAIVPLEASGARTHAAVPGSTYVVIADGPHGIGVSHTDEVNAALLDFLAG